MSRCCLSMLLLVGCAGPATSPDRADEQVTMTPTAPEAFRVVVTGAALGCEDEALRVNAEVVGRPTSARAVVVAADQTLQVVELDAGSPAPDVVFVPLTGTGDGCVEGTLAVIVEDEEASDCWVRGPATDDLLSGALDAQLGEAAGPWDKCRTF